MIKYLTFIVLGFAMTGELSADSESRPIVSGFERFAQVDEISNAERGLLLLNELNCTSCHAGRLSWTVPPKQAPRLTDVGSRVLPEHLESFLLQPRASKPGTTMPDVLAGRPAQEKQKIAESLAHFLASTGKSVKQSSSATFVMEGEKLFHSIGCVACHDPQNEDTTIASSVPLGSLATKYSLPGLTNFIKDPLHVRPSGRMPQFNLSESEAQRISAYLLRDAVVDSKINFAYYEGSWEKLPNFAQLKPASTGTASGFEMGVGPRNNNYGIVFTGYWATAAEGEYRFRLSSDDGSRLVIDGETVVENDGVHPVISKEGVKNLSVGLHEVRVEFFEAQGGEELKVDVFGDNLDGVSLESLLRATPEEANQPLTAFVLDAAKSDLGKKYFYSMGCANCHEMDSGQPRDPVSYPDQKPIERIRVSAGCLAGSNDAPDFGLSEFQIECITAAIREIGRPQTATDDLEVPIHQKLLTLNCYACHNRERADKQIRGGVVDMTGDSLEVFERQQWFTGLHVEMGDEGQHPPALKSVGAKLNPQWLDHVLQQGADDRPYMLTRMPKFGVENFGRLAQELVAADILDGAPQITQSEDTRTVKAHGRFFAGEESLSCIKCHTFGKYDATGIQSIDLTTMTQRLNKDWFQIYMRKPSRFRRGTRMPESWPGGKSYYPDILDGDANKQIDAIWQFLSDGANAAKPKGLIRSKMELKPTESPIVYRNFIEGAGSRAIGVGYPEQVNLAFDAQLCRLALIWQENFIDASRHWTGRGQGFEPPLGENVLKLPDSVVFAMNLDGNAWSPEAKPPKFRGYHFDDQRRPIFTYQLDDVTIEDQPLPWVENSRPLLKRVFKITSTEQQRIFFLAGITSEAKVKIRDRVAQLGDRLRITGNGNSNWTTRKNDADSELILEIDLSDGAAEVEITYDW